MLLLLLFGYLFITIFVANQDERKRDPIDPIGSEAGRSTRLLLYAGVVLVFLLGAYILLLGFSGDDLEGLAAEQGPDVVVPEVTPDAAMLMFSIAAGLGLAAFVVINRLDIRRRLHLWIGKSGRFDPDSPVHMTAAVLALMMLAAQMVFFMLQGGVSGMAEDIETRGVSIIEILFQAGLQVVIAFLGVGWAVRRTWPQVRRRLGLWWPTPDDLMQGVWLGVKLVGILLLYGILMGILIAVGVVSEGDLAQQNEATDSLAKAFATLPLALMLSLSAAVGEEILFRGALQPVFGNLSTSVFFALMHTQNLASVGVVLIFIVSYLLGRLRERRGTVAAMAGHFTYNFIQLGFLILGTYAESAV